MDILNKRFSKYKNVNILNLDFSISEPPHNFLLSRPKEIYSISKYLKEVLKDQPKDVLTELKENLININKENYE